MLNSKMKADLIIKNASVVDVFGGDIVKGNVAIKGGRFLGIGDYSDATKTIDAEGKFISPTFTDSHVHIESSMISPKEFVKCLLSHGVSTIICDPHEIANVCGLDGIRYILDETANLPANVFVMLPSCVPATEFETSGACLKASDYEDLIKNDRVLGLGEMMNYVGTVNRDPEILSKISLASNLNKIIDGHAPMLSGRDLDDYALAGISTDHEASTVLEMKERISRGMYVAIRNGTAAKNLKTLLNGLNDINFSRCFFCTDDSHPYDLVSKGSIDNMVNEAIAFGISPIKAIAMATINPMLAYGIDGIGAIAPGYKADFFLFDSMNRINPDSVFISGNPVSLNGEFLPKFHSIPPKEVLSKMNVREILEEDLKLLIPSGIANVIKIEKDSLITTKETCEVKTLNDEFLFSDNDILKICVIDRHSGKSNISVGLIKGYGLKNGAIGTTVAHDSHNIIVVGDNDEDMLLVIKKIVSMSGGMALSSKGSILGSLQLDIAGLMSSKPLETVSKTLNSLISKARSLGIPEGVDPFMTLSFMYLPVIPHLKITDKGLFDVDAFKMIPVDATK